MGYIILSRPAAQTPETLVGIFVATDGNDTTGDGTEASPYATPEKAYSEVSVGDTIYMRGGTYALIGAEGIHLTGASGTSGNPITIRNYPDETPIIDGLNMTVADDTYNSSTSAGGYALQLWNLSWIHLLGIEIKDGPMGGIIVQGSDAVGSHNNIYELLNIHGCGHGSNAEGKGFTLFGYATNNLLLNIDSHDNADIPEDNADGFQIAMKDSTSTGNILRGCRAWNNSDDGFDFFNIWDEVAGAPLTVESCWAWDNGFESDGVTISGGDGNGFKLAGQRPGAGTSGGHTVTNCASWGNKMHGFDDNAATIAINLWNCTAYNNVRAGDSDVNPETFGDFDWGRGVYMPQDVDHDIRNNISHQPSGDTSTFIFETAAGNPNTSDNSWQDATVTDADFKGLDDTEATGARQSDGSLVGSDCINAGTDVGLGFNGAAPDLGAFET